MSLFDRVETVAGAQPVRFAVRMLHDRGSLTDPLFQQPVGNERSWWRETMRDFIAAEVTGIILHRAGDRVRAESPEAWRDALTAWRARLAADAPPVLLFGHDWPWDGRTDLADAIADRLTHDSPSAWSRDRTPFLDGWEIVRLPISGPTLLAPKNMFRRIAFGRGDEGQVLAVAFEPSADQPTMGTLTVSGSLALELDRPERALVLEAARAGE